MILLIHRNAEKGLKVLRQSEELKLDSRDLCGVFWKLAEAYPEEILVWVEEELQEELNLNAVEEILHHDLIMASYAVKTKFLPETIGYIDQLPFVKVDRRVHYGTWHMSSDMGAVKADTLLKFKPLFQNIRNFGYLLNQIAKLGQQNGLFCYSAPSLWKSKEKGIPILETKARTTEVFRFVYSQYKSIRVFLLFWHYCKFEKSLPLVPLLGTLTARKYFQKQVDLSGIKIRSSKIPSNEATIDVIIPTMGRREYLLQVMEDLRNQTALPKKVVVVEQDPMKNSNSDLPELEVNYWPFEIVHIFTHKTGACNARNLALEKIDADWIFFADDDLRLKTDFLEKGLKQILRYQFDQMTFDCRQEGEKIFFKNLKQWGAFGSGNSIVSGKFVKKLRFDTALEFGYGEDIEYGMQLRAAGCDIVYHPEIQLLHLKAPRGGFREVKLRPWEKEDPKPSPTLMLLFKKYYTVEQLRGYRTELLLRYYPRQSIKNPLKYIKEMKRRWVLSEVWASKLHSIEKPVEDINSF